VGDEKISRLKIKILGFYYIFESEKAEAKTREYFIFV
jgi:hypothetical protein